MVVGQGENLWLVVWVADDGSDGPRAGEEEGDETEGDLAVAAEEEDVHSILSCIESNLCYDI